MALGWPATLTDGPISVRPLRGSDAKTWEAIRFDDDDWLSPWEATLPPGVGTSASYREIIRVMRRRAASGQMMPFAVTYNGVMVGQVTVNGVTRGSAEFANLGYWIASKYAGRQITPTAVALVADHLMTTAELHRVEIAIRPENAASLRVAAKLGFEFIGLARRYLHIAGDWRDHFLFQIIAEDFTDGVLNRFKAQHA